MNLPHGQIVVKNVNMKSEIPYNAKKQKYG